MTPAKIALALGLALGVPGAGLPEQRDFRDAPAGPPLVHVWRTARDPGSFAVGAVGAGGGAAASSGLLVAIWEDGWTLRAVGRGRYQAGRLACADVEAARRRLAALLATDLGDVLSSHADHLSLAVREGCEVRRLTLPVTTRLAEARARYWELEAEAETLARLPLVEGPFASLAPPAGVLATGLGEEPSERTLHAGERWSAGACRLRLLAVDPDRSAAVVELEGPAGSPAAARLALDGGRTLGHGCCQATLERVASPWAPESSIPAATLRLVTSEAP